MYIVLFLLFVLFLLSHLFLKVIDPSRRLKREGQLTLWKGKERIAVWVWLFNDLVVIGRPKSGKYLDEGRRKPNCFSAVAKIPLSCAHIINLAPMDGE